MHDYPALKSLTIKFRSSFFAMIMDLDVGDRFRRWTNDPRLRELCMSLEDKTKAYVHIRCLTRMRREEIELKLQSPQREQPPAEVPRQPVKIRQRELPVMLVVMVNP